MKNKKTTTVVANCVCPEKGITLVALVITIIVLLILAGITVSLVMGENGIINRGKKASEDYAIAQCKEKIELALQDLSVEQVSKGEKLTKEVLPKLNNEEISVGEIETFPVEVICGKYKYNIDENFAVTYVGEADGTVVTYTTDPVGYTNQTQVKILVKVKNPKGIKTITEPSGDIITVSNGRTEVAIDYTVTANGTYIFKVISVNDKETTKNVVIDQIDRLAPKDFTITVSENETGILINEETEDIEATDESICSGIDRYEYYMKKSAEDTYTKYSENKIENLPTGDYSIYVVAYDKAGNFTKSNTVETSAYVWEVWDAQTKVVYEPKTKDGIINTNDKTSSYFVGRELIETTNGYRFGSGFSRHAGDILGYYYYYDEPSTVIYISKRITLTYSPTNGTTYMWSGTVYYKEAITKVTKGENQYANIFKLNNKQYPEDGAQDEYYYILKKD